MSCAVEGHREKTAIAALRTAIGVVQVAAWTVKGIVYLLDYEMIVVSERGAPTSRDEKDSTHCEETS